LGGIIVKRVRPHNPNQAIYIKYYISTWRDFSNNVQFQALAYSASRTAPKTAHLHSIYTSTFALLFFGTPHHGSSRVRLLSSLERLAFLAVPKENKILQTDSALVSAIESNSEVLEDITDQFTPLMHRFRIFFFWEQNRTDLKYTKDYIVDEPSAAPIMDSTERSGIAADHRGMCKFEKSSDQGFRIVVAALKRYGRQAPEFIRMRTVEAMREIEAKRWAEAAELLRGVQSGGGQNLLTQSAVGRAQVRPAIASRGGVPALREY
jgi:hypothetical protein